MLTTVGQVHGVPVLSYAVNNITASQHQEQLHNHQKNPCMLGPTHQVVVVGFVS